MEAGFTTGDSTSQFSLNVQFKSNILVPFSAQKLSNCLAAVNGVKNSQRSGSYLLYTTHCISLQVTRATAPDRVL